MQHLIQGMESAAKIDLLLSLTRTASDKLKSALHDHYVKGFGESEAASLNGVTKSNLSRAMKNLNEVMGTVDVINQLSGN